MQSTQTSPVTPEAGTTTVSHQDPNVSALIDNHIEAIRSKDPGVRRSLYKNFGMVEREQNLLAVDVRCGDERVARQKLAVAWDAKHETKQDALPQEEVVH